MSGGECGVPWSTCRAMELRNSKFGFVSVAIWQCHDPCGSELSNLVKGDHMED